MIPKFADLIRKLSIIVLILVSYYTLSTIPVKTSLGAYGPPMAPTDPDGPTMDPMAPGRPPMAPGRPPMDPGRPPTDPDGPLPRK